MIWWAFLHDAVCVNASICAGCPSHNEILDRQKCNASIDRSDRCNGGFLILWDVLRHTAATLNLIASRSKKQIARQGEFVKNASAMFWRTRKQLQRSVLCVSAWAHNDIHVVGHASSRVLHQVVPGHVCLISVAARLGAGTLFMGLCAHCSCASVVDMSRNMNLSTHPSERVVSSRLIDLLLKTRPDDARGNGG